MVDEALVSKDQTSHATTIQYSNPRTRAYTRRQGYNVAINGFDLESTEFISGKKDLFVPGVWVSDVWCKGKNGLNELA